MMKTDAVLDYAVFQLTPTRTRCELLISAKGVTEKLASGLLKPFLSQLQAAQDQLASGGYSIKLDPPLDGKQNKPSWFSKGTLQKFVRFVSTPAVLERVTAVDAELLRLEDEFNSYVPEGDDQLSVTGSAISYAGAKRKSGLQFKTGKDPVDELEAEPIETSRDRLLKALEGRQSMLQREQGMAFARAIAAGFDMEHLPQLIAFAEHFGAHRLREACVKFVTLCKKQEEGGLWLDEMELVAAEGGFSYPESNGIGITIAPGMDTFGNTKEAAEEDDSIKCVDEQQKRFSMDRVGHVHDHPQQGQGPPYPWMPFNAEQAYDPRYFPAQNVMGMPNYPVYWPPPGYSIKPDQNGDEENSESKKVSRKSLSRRKRVQVGRAGKRPGMFVIKNVNLVAPKSSAKGESGSETSESDEDGSSEDEDDEEVAEVEKSRKRGDKNRKRGKGSKSKKSVTSVGSSESSASATGANEELQAQKAHPQDAADVFTMPERPQAKAAGYDNYMDETFVMPTRTNTSTRGSGLSVESETLRRQPQGADDSFIIPQRAGDQSGLASSYQPDHPQPRESQSTGSGIADDFFIVPTRVEVASSRDTTLELEEQMYMTKIKPEESAAKTEEPDEVWLLPERTTNKDTVERRWNDIDYNIEAMASLQKNNTSEKSNEEEDSFYEQYQEQRDAKLRQEQGTKKAEREAKLKSLQDTLDKRKAEISSRYKATRSSILKSKKEREEEERRRIEELAAQRRNRIAARSGSHAGVSSRNSSNSQSSATAARGATTRSSSLARPKVPSTGAQPAARRSSLSSVTGLQQQQESKLSRSSIGSVRELRGSAEPERMKSKAGLGYGNKLLPSQATRVA